MEENLPYKKPIEEKDIPISVPSVDEAWSDMLRRLEKNKPFADLFPDPVEKSNPLISLNRFLLGIVLLSFIAFITVLYFHEDHTDKKIQDNRIIIGTSNMQPNKKERNISSGLIDHNRVNVKIPYPAIEHKSVFILKETSQKDQKKAVDIAEKNARESRFDANSPRTSVNEKFISTKAKTGKLEVKRPLFNRKNKDFAVRSYAGNEKYPIANPTNKNLNETPADANAGAIPFTATQELYVPASFDSLPDGKPFNKEVLHIDTLLNQRVTQNINIPDLTENSIKWQLQAGLSWSMQIPLSGTRGYFQGPNASSQPYRILFPALWIQSVKDKSITSVEINPFLSNLLPEKPFRTSTTVSYLPDTTITTTEVKTLYKVFGISTSIGYNYNIGKNWWVGGNMQFNWWTKGLAYSNGLIQKKPVNGGASAQDINFEKEYQISDEWSYFNRAQFFINAEFLYRKDKWQAGITTGISATPLAKNEGPGNSFRMSLFYRWALYTRH